MKPATLLAAATLLVLTGAASAEVYRQVDAQGNVTFSDEPSSGAEAVPIKPVTTITLPKLKNVERDRQPQEQKEARASLYNSVSFLAPKNNEAFHSGNGDVQFQVASNPALRNGHKYEVTVDGQPVGQSTSGTIMVQNMDRGTHRAGVNIINANGDQVTTGNGVTFTIHRPSRLN